MSDDAEGSKSYTTYVTSEGDHLVVHGVRGQIKAAIDGAIDRSMAEDEVMKAIINAFAALTSFCGLLEACSRAQHEAWKAFRYHSNTSKENEKVAFEVRQIYPCNQEPIPIIFE